MTMGNSNTIDTYIGTFPEEVQAKLEEIRKIIHQTAPEAQEKISYGIPTFTLSGNLVHFAAYKTHIGFYPGSRAVSEFASELKPYETSKGTVRLHLDKPLPITLIRKIVELRVKQNTSVA
ncbi:DUF1801 domain-containing protein [Candidatus Saccharibacteria bacterium]|nr:DUF1801 domain-containing protein [Candidatus Saccharibacteria bacterium]